MYKILKVTLFLFTFSCQIISSQSFTSSPYTRFGLGEIQNASFGRSQAMGGMGIALRSNAMLNPMNPASYSAIDTLSQILEFGFNADVSLYSDGTNESVEDNMNFSYVSVAFPISKEWGFSFGLQPVTQVGYNFSFSEDDPVASSFDYQGSGGLSKVFIGTGYEIANRLSLGISASYIFGRLSKSSFESFPDNASYATFNSSEDLDIRGMQLSYGAQYFIPLKNNRKITLGAVYEPQIQLDAHTSIVSNRILPNGVGSVELENISNKSVDMAMPRSYGLGVTFEEQNKFTVGAEYYTKQWSQVEYYGVTDSLSTTHRLSVGGEYIPAYDNKSYFKRVQYRLGAYTQNDYLGLYDSGVFDFGITFGLGLPLNYSSKTLFNMSFEYAKRGTTDANLVRHDLYKVTVNMSLNDIWFMKRKFE